METKTNQGEGKIQSAALEYPIAGKSKVVEQLKKQIAQLAKTRKDVVIVGEAGIGKGAVAKNIFFRSNIGGDKPFMSINLSVVDDRELEAVLFGFDRGVGGLPYTSKRGLFEQANGGTVLIEEIEEASFRNQLKILNFLNERKTRRMGGDVNESVDIRLIITMKTIGNDLHPFGQTWEVIRAYQPVGRTASTYAYPNPFSPDDEVVRLHYSVGSTQGTVTIEIFDFGMNRVRTIVKDAPRSSSFEYDEIWDGRDDENTQVANGVYFYRVVINSGDPTWGKIMVLQ